MSEGLERPEREGGTPGEEPTLRNRTVFRDALWGGSGESGRWGGGRSLRRLVAGHPAGRHRIAIPVEQDASWYVDLMTTRRR